MINYKDIETTKELVLSALMQNIILYEMIDDKLDIKYSTVKPYVERAFDIVIRELRYREELENLTKGMFE